uniref:Gfo/Idh/MocA-like oxidoreductase N-terminal domain-containing protein n=1 Tax=Arcella intermedia TaxID=1963864 RepID=A0A6B2L7L8_9EUKA|eukprot:TRINITY_DN3926_c0_g1_i1.p1 TRINITY_DN3926_c0_g1~~TRINITY_DN3926_c0_g1_i1.p1  ORF type:complete len:384 (-),score=7.61 TRINITY_DN3926_c0_g1_i1:248-1234(-)
MAAKYAIPPENQFSDWKQIDAKIADAVVIATQDKMHSEPAVHFSNLGYHVLLEKPMATTEGECRRIYEALKANKTIFAIGHVLRYTPLNLKIKGIVESGVLGDIINIQHLEPVGNFHFAHSYVRGNWRKESESSFSLLAKSCHDIDWILWMMNKECVKVSSFGSLKHFTKANKPEGATDRCLSCPVEAECAYSAKKIYLDTIKRGHTGWPVKILTDSTPTEATVLEALQNGPYGRCVYECDNDVADNQVVNFCFADGSTASFTMVAFSEEICVRKTRIFGSKGELEVSHPNNLHTSPTHFSFITHVDRRPQSHQSVRLPYQKINNSSP